MKTKAQGKTYWAASGWGLDTLNGRTFDEVKNCIDSIPGEDRSAVFLYAAMLACLVEWPPPLKISLYGNGDIYVESGAAAGAQTVSIHHVAAFHILNGWAMQTAQEQLTHEDFLTLCTAVWHEKISFSEALADYALEQQKHTGKRLAYSLEKAEANIDTKIV